MIEFEIWDVFIEFGECYGFFECDFVVDVFDVSEDGVSRLIDFDFVVVDVCLMCV